MIGTNSFFPWTWDQLDHKEDQGTHTPFYSTKCKCGASKIAIWGTPKIITLCHCSYCRKARLEDMRQEHESPSEEDDSASDASQSGCSQRIGPMVFLGFQRECCEFSFEVEYIEGPNNGRHSCRKCGQLIHVSLFKKDIVYINAGLFEFSERLTRERLEHLSSLHTKDAHTPYVAHVWCKSDETFEPEYRHYFDYDLPFYCCDVGLSPRGTINGMQLSMGEFKRLRNLGVASGKQKLRSTTIGSDGREWTNEELKRVFNAAKFDRIDELKELIEKGAPVDCTPYGSQSPTYIAAFYGKLRSLKYLTAANADLNKIEKDGFTPSHASSSEGHVECLRWLQENGGSLQVATTTGQTCLSLARRANRKDCIRFLESVVSVKEWSATEMKKVFDAAKSGRIEELKGYIDCGAPIDCTPYGSQTPTYIACFYGREECLEFLADHGADLNKTEKDGFTPAHAAASEGHISCLVKLMRFGADLSYSTSGGQTCMTLAARADRTNVVRWLKANHDLIPF